MKYTNPVIQADYSDPDVIRVGDDFYMVASSFNHVPGVPVLHSKNLVEWEIINYVLPTIPFKRFNKVCHGEGAWAPSIRFQRGKFYCLIPFPDEGIFVSETDNPASSWSPLRPLLLGKGFEDPCPIWENGKCYVVFAFVKSRVGFNSRLAIFETDGELRKLAEDYKIIYDGHDVAPNIEGPKFYKRNGYYYLFCPAGGITSGWQTVLRSKDIYGPYRTKVVMVQGDTPVNGPHQGALVDLPGGSGWAFVHFQDMGPYGRVVHLQPVKWLNDWPFCGELHDENLPGFPVDGGDYPVDVKTDYCIEPTDEFDRRRLSPVWQTPANPGEDWYFLKGGLKLNCIYHGQDSLSDLPNIFMQKVPYLNFSVKTKCRLNLVHDGDETGFVIFGREYYYICIVRRGDNNYLEIRRGYVGGNYDEALCQSQLYNDDSIDFQAAVRYEDKNKMTFKFTTGDISFAKRYYAQKGVWTGAKIGIYARTNGEPGGSALYKYFRVKNNGNG